MLNPIQQFAIHTITKGILIGILIMFMVQAANIVNFTVAGTILVILFYTFLVDFSDLGDKK
jgi:hypothetical protein